MFKTSDIKNILASSNNEAILKAKENLKLTKASKIPITKVLKIIESCVKYFWTLETDFDQWRKDTDPVCINLFKLIAKDALDIDDHGLFSEGAINGDIIASFRCERLLQPRHFKLLEEVVVVDPARANNLAKAIIYLSRDIDVDMILGENFPFYPINFYETARFFDFLHSKRFQITPAQRQAIIMNPDIDFNSHIKYPVSEQDIIDMINMIERVQILTPVGKTSKLSQSIANLPFLERAKHQEKQMQASQKSDGPSNNLS